ncbi:unnamed protein product [Prunus armeniaca]|uniref:Uncharacterized protein n=1 Tax=Prunus armeniaca TaxID=36596 RepID=A0A6J5X6U8_PRUAR|nr:unnamed protein product [Prunus armeniaca]
MLEFYGKESVKISSPLHQDPFLKTKGGSTVSSTEEETATFKPIGYLSGGPTVYCHVDHERIFTRFIEAMMLRVYLFFVLSSMRSNKWLTCGKLQV